MTAHGSDNVASRFPESLSEAQISEKKNEKAIPMNKKKATNFGLDVFQGKVLFLNIILRLNFTREAEIDSTKQLSPSKFVYKFQNTTQKHKDCNFFLH